MHMPLIVVAYFVVWLTLSYVYVRACRAQVVGTTGFHLKSRDCQLRALDKYVQLRVTRALRVAI